MSELDTLRITIARQSAEIARKDAALRNALDALETAAMNDPAREDDHYYDIVADAVREVLG
jgi:hypothetical protein